MSKDPYKPRFGEPYTKWRKWYAWRPVDTVEAGLIWLRPVYRRRIQGYDFLWGTDRWWQYAKHPNDTSGGK